MLTIYKQLVSRKNTTIPFVNHSNINEPISGKTIITNHSVTIRLANELSQQHKTAEQPLVYFLNDMSELELSLSRKFSLK